MANKIKLTKEIKSKWIEALESGKFTQIDGQLHETISNSHCCLGVLCLIAPLPNPLLNGDYNDIVSLLGRDNVDLLWSTNDNTFDADKPDYSNVLPLIKELQTID